MKTLVALIFVVGCALHAQVPQQGLRLWLRADSLVTRNDVGQVQSWKNIVDGRAAIVPAGSSAITVAPLNGRPAMVFDGAAYFVAPSLMPVGRDYTVAVVMKVNNRGATNNIVSGENRAFWLAGADFPRMLHNGNFSQQAISSVGIDDASVVRVRYNATSSIARIDVNNKQGAADPIPSNTDSVIYLGAFNRGNFFSGQIAEVLVYDREVDGADVLALDTYLHSRYSIQRAADRVASPVTIDVAPANLLLAKCGDSLFVAGRVARSNVRTVTVAIDSSGVEILSRQFSDLSIDESFRVGFVVSGGASLYSTTVSVDTGGTDQLTVLNNRNIACGEVIAITGQSNTIWGRSRLTPSPFARTFGGNHSAQRSDTSYKQSTAVASGGGASVGAWGLYLQNAIMQEMATPTLVINGGVGGTAIQQHLPDANNRLNLATIYGSWLYRVIQSGSRERIRWLFWYQGESNGGSDDYMALFDQLRNAWHADLPNLQHIVVVQIRPGCGPEGHTAIRDAQRRFEDRYPDVIVHAAAALPQHDGCHYNPEGYLALGEQLFEIYRVTELGMFSGRFALSPTIEGASCMDDECKRIRFTMKRASGLRMTPDTMVGNILRTAKEAFFANSVPSQQPLRVTVADNVVELLFDTPVSRFSYVPDKHYLGTTVVYQGPWLVNESGVGALTFHDVDVAPTSINEEVVGAERRQEGLVFDLMGNVVANNIEEVQKLSSGVYILVDEGKALKVVHVR